MLRPVAARGDKEKFYPHFFICARRIFLLRLKIMNYRNGFIIPIAIIILALIVGAGSFLFLRKEVSTPKTSENIHNDEEKTSTTSLTSLERASEKKEKDAVPLVAQKNSISPLARIPTPAPQKKDEHKVKSPEASKVPSSPPVGYTMLPSAPAHRQSPEFPTQAELSQIPACGREQFVTVPIDIQKIMSISPLGNLAPPGHTFPTEHMFFHITAGDATTETVPLRSPADVYLTLISIGRGLTKDPVDYTLYFALCKDVMGYYNHVKALSPELEMLVSQSSCMFPGESKETRCNIQTLHRVANGSEIGKVGRLQGNFDLGLIDFKKQLTFANPSRYGTRSLYIQCPLDYYNTEGKAALYNLLERNDGRCGRTDQDVLGTLKGNWFYGSARADMGGDWDKLLAFADDSKNPSLSVISIGGIIGPAEKWEFTPESSGMRNRVFDGVLPDGEIYCYESSKKPGKMIVQLTSPGELKIEKQNEPCASSRSFVNPTTYRR